MKRESFIAVINSYEKQLQYDATCASKLSEVYKESGSASLLYDNHYINNAFLQLLQEVMSDGDDGHSWIEYFCFELDFGRENWRLKARDEHGEDIPLNNAGELYDFLTR